MNWVAIIDILKVFAGVLAGVGSISGSIVWLVHKNRLTKLNLRREVKFRIQEFIFQIESDPFPPATNDVFLTMINAITLYDNTLDISDIEEAYSKKDFITCNNLLYDLMASI